MSAKVFGDEFIELRTSAGFSLRKFCKKMNLDPGNWSRVERGVSKPPLEKEFYNRIENIFNISSSKKEELISMAKAIRIIPKELQETELMEHMPVMLRKIDGQPLKNDEIEGLVNWITDTVKSEYK